jgi:hypothetical protein
VSIRLDNRLFLFLDVFYGFDLIYEPSVSPYRYAGALGSSGANASSQYITAGQCLAFVSVVFIFLYLPV